MYGLPYKRTKTRKKWNLKVLCIFITLFNILGRLDCKTCPAGYYCHSGIEAPIACASGTYNPSVLQGDVSSCFQCKAGMACPETGLTAPSVECSAGFFCPAGSVLPNATVNACPAGTYTDYHNLTAARECKDCPKGQACVAGTGGKQKPPQECAAGNFDIFGIILSLHVRRWKY